MPSYFDVRRGTTPDQLAALYLDPNRTPEQVDSDLFLNAPRGYDYIRNQFSQLFPNENNPIDYFKQLRQQGPPQLSPQTSAQAPAAQAVPTIASLYPDLAGLEPSQAFSVARVRQQQEQLDNVFKAKESRSILQSLQSNQNLLDRAPGLLGQISQSSPSGNFSPGQSQTLRNINEAVIHSPSGPNGVDSSIFSNPNFQRLQRIDPRSASMFYQEQTGRAMKDDLEIAQTHAYESYKNQREMVEAKDRAEQEIVRRFFQQGGHLQGGKWFGPGYVQDPMQIGGLKRDFSQVGPEMEGWINKWHEQVTGIPAEQQAATQFQDSQVANLLRHDPEAAAAVDAKNSESRSGPMNAQQTLIYLQSLQNRQAQPSGWRGFLEATAGTLSRTNAGQQYQQAAEEAERTNAGLWNRPSLIWAGANALKEAATTLLPSPFFSHESAETRAMHEQQRRALLSPDMQAAYDAAQLQGGF